MIGLVSADVAYFITHCHDVKECGKRHAMEMDEMIKKIGYPRSHSTTFVNTYDSYFMSTMIY